MADQLLAGQAGTRIARDLECANCGYNLRTMSADGCCPECGWPVPRTLAAPGGGGTPLLIAAFLLCTIPWFLAQPLAVLVPIREGAGTVTILFAVATVAALVLLVIGCRNRRKWGRHHFGHSGPLAMLLCSVFVVIQLAVTLFAGYLSRDTTIYAPAFNKQAYFSIRPGTPRASVEQLIGPGLTTWIDAASGDRWVQYSRRAGFMGWQHIVQYSQEDRVTRFRCDRTAD